MPPLPLSPPPPCGQVLFISADPEAYLFQPENTLKLKPWRDDPNDTTLLDLLPMLQVRWGAEESHITMRGRNG